MDLINKGLIPLDKSWMIRLGVLDILSGDKQIVEFLEKQEELNDDVKALLNAAKSWNTNEIDVGESGTLYRFLRFASWKLGLKKKFILHGTLEKRKICDDPEIVNWPLKKLLELDNGTSQWASAAVLLGNEEKVENAPYKLKVTYEAKKYWDLMRESNLPWEARYDETILKQAENFLKLLETGKLNFKAEQAEDYCFSRAFNLISKEEGERRWKSLRGHESDRIEEMENSLE